MQAARNGIVWLGCTLSAIMGAQFVPPAQVALIATGGLVTLCVMYLYLTIVR